jgi:truncated hemoglobin YjbI
MVRMNTLREYLYGRHYKALQRAYSDHEEMNARQTFAEVLSRFYEHVENLKETDPFFEISELEDERSTTKLFDDFVSHKLNRPA